MRWGRSGSEAVAATGEIITYRYPYLDLVLSGPATALDTCPESLVDSYYSSSNYLKLDHRQRNTESSIQKRQVIVDQVFLNESERLVLLIESHHSGRMMNYDPDYVRCSLRSFHYTQDLDIERDASGQPTSIAVRGE